MHGHVFLGSLSHVLNVNLRGSCYGTIVSRSKASDVIGMAPLCSVTHKGLCKQWRRKENTESNVTEHMLKQQSKENTD